MSDHWNGMTAETLGVTGLGRPSWPQFFLAFEWSLDFSIYLLWPWMGSEPALCLSPDS